MESTKRSSSKSSLSGVKIPAQLKKVNPLTVLIGAAIGGAVMYMLDPVAGANRRSTFLARIKSMSSSTTTGVSSQFSSLSGFVSAFISSWMKSAPETTSQSDDSTSSDVSEAAAKGTTTSTYARKVAATDPDAYTATH